MKRLALFAAAFCLLVVSAAPARAQIGLDFFKKSSIAKYLNPVVGKGAEYQSIRKKGDSEEKERSMIMGVVGKDSFEGKEAFWMEVVSHDDKDQINVSKILLTREDFGFHRMIMQMHGQPAMEMPFNPSKATQEKIDDKFKEWHSVGTEPVTVPAGTFLCEHLHNDKTGGDLWASDKITPFGMVKSVDSNSTMVLVKLIPDFPEHITGPVKQFDPQAIREQMMQKRNPNQ